MWLGIHEIRLWTDMITKARGTSLSTDREYMKQDCTDIITKTTWHKLQKQKLEKTILFLHHCCTIIIIFCLSSFSRYLLSLLKFFIMSIVKKLLKYFFFIITQLLQKEKEVRLGAKQDFLEIKSHDFFADINWQDLYDKRITPPYNPNVVCLLV